MTRGPAARSSSRSSRSISTSRARRALAGETLPLTQAPLRGDEIRFAFTGAGGARLAFTGRVAGDRIVGEGGGDRWMAVRTRAALRVSSAATASAAHDVVIIVAVRHFSANSTLAGVISGTRRVPANRAAADGAGRSPASKPGRGLPCELKSALLIGALAAFSSVHANDVRTGVGGAIGGAGGAAIGNEVGGSTGAIVGGAVGGAAGGAVGASGQRASRRVVGGAIGGGAGAAIGNEVGGSKGAIIGAGVGGAAGAVVGGAVTADSKPKAASAPQPLLTTGPTY